ncbi:serine/threonine protein kinase [Nocardia panacis]|uniref:non-specific serine/threonine protein kinase n=1 Tax=Nocardia panacis TaxID=2340916 RepID=A0A3A4KDT1_9NOCA|nr:serine/threonine protein kinase [Nocardia panacis]
MVERGDVFAGYRIEGLLGRGGMGEVYRAWHPRLPKLVALKLLNRDLLSDTEVRARFEREADLVARLEHVGIVAVLDRGEQDGRLWMTMQYVDGHDATRLDQGATAVGLVVHVVESVAAALDYAHGRGMLHRDVKPANILLERPSTAGVPPRVLLADFGIARLRADAARLTRTGVFTATLTYASPEQMTTGRVVPASDQYSLACSLFRLLTGGGPFDAPDPVQIITGHLQLPPPPITAVRPDLPAGLDAVLVRALAKRPEDRYPSCGEFAAAARAAVSRPETTVPEAISARSAPTVLNVSAPPAPTVRASDPAPAPASPAPVGKTPTKGSRSRSRAVLAAAVLAVVAAVVVVAATSTSRDGGSGAPAAARSTTPDAAAIHASYAAAESARSAANEKINATRALFPTLLPQNDDGNFMGIAPSGADCTGLADGRAANEDFLGHIDAVGRWVCNQRLPGAVERRYIIAVFATATAAQAAVNTLAARPTLIVKDETETFVRTWSDPLRTHPPSDLRDEKLAVTFAPDLPRAHIVIYAHQHDYEPLLPWWRQTTL